MSLGDNSTTYPNLKRKHQYCDVCVTLLPAPGFFCVKCDPPEPPDPDPEKGLIASQASLRIVLLILVFIVVAVVRLEIDLQNLAPEEVASEASLKVAEDEDFKLLFKVKVSSAKLHDKPNTKTSKIIFVLSKGTPVEVLGEKGNWSKIRSNPRPGEESQTGWLASKLLDSEIK
jgi:hypothetical protein